MIDSDKGCDRGDTDWKQLLGGCASMVPVLGLLKPVKGSNVAVVSWWLALSSRKGNKEAYKTGREKKRVKDRERGKSSSQHFSFSFCIVFLFSMI